MWNMWNICKTYVKHVKILSNICQTYVKHMWTVCQTYMKHMWNTCETHVKQGRGESEIYVKSVSSKKPNTYMWDTFKLLSSCEARQNQKMSNRQKVQQERSKKKNNWRDRSTNRYCHANVLQTTSSQARRSSAKQEQDRNNNDIQAHFQTRCETHVKHMSWNAWNVMDWSRNALLLYNRFGNAIAHVSESSLKCLPKMFFSEMIFGIFWKCLGLTVLDFLEMFWKCFQNGFGHVLIMCWECSANVLEYVVLMFW